ncbi:hypothetical protein ACFVW2_35505, partial [Streptomyces sp. NPDC058171]
GVDGLERVGATVTVMLAAQEVTAWTALPEHTRTVFGAPSFAIFIRLLSPTWSMPRGGAP